VWAEDSSKTTLRRSPRVATVALLGLRITPRPATLPWNFLLSRRVQVRLGLEPLRCGAWARNRLFGVGLYGISGDRASLVEERAPTVRRTFHLGGAGHRIVV